MNISRRRFLTYGGLTLGAAGFVHQFNNLAALAQMVSGNDYKALVCIFLAGGNDSFNTVVPLDADEYALYAQARPQLAIPQEELLRIEPADLTHGDRPYGFNPRLERLHNLWSQEKLAVICNVGNLVEPITKAQFMADERVRPLSLFDHSAQQSQCQILSNGQSGWGNRMGTLLSNLNGNARLPLLINVSSGASVYLSGGSPYITLKSSADVGVETLQGFESGNTADEARLRAMTLMRRQAADAPIVDSIGDNVSMAVDNAALASQVLSDPTPIETDIPKSPLGLQMLQIAKMIRSREALGLNKRQIFYATLGGFDTHGVQLATHPSLMTQVDAAMSAFYEATVELGIEDKVTTFLLSEFGRTANDSNDGTDHGWGGHLMAMGGAVNGGKFYGEYPSLVIGGPLDIVAPGDNTPRGRILPTTSFEQYAATLAEWFGLDAAGIAEAIPNIGRFSPQTLGFMQAP